MVWVYLSTGLALVVILGGFGAALVIYHRRFLAMHRSFSDNLLTAQEQERATVAREVHDDALQRIMVLLQDLDEVAVKGNDQPHPVHEGLGAMRAELVDLSASLRQMAYRLHPSFVQEMGIVPMLERLAAEVDRSAGTHVEVHGSLASPPELSSDQCLAVYRIAQEALSNVIRHAGKTRAILQVAEADHALELTVEDYGTGFDVTGPRRRGLGLVSMAERARAIGGTLSVESHPGGGTRVMLRLPVGNGGSL